MNDPILFLDLNKQQARIGKILKDRIDKVFSHGKFILGPEVQELEDRLAEYVGASYCIGVSSGTDAIQIALMGENVGRGDAVFLPAFTYTATAEVPLLLGATPIFVDINPETFQIDPINLKSAIDKVKKENKLKPKAIIGVDLFGQPAPWNELRQIAKDENLFLLDDCAQSFGGQYHGKKLGSQADATITSFFPSKPFGAYGDGGAIFTNSLEKFELYRSLRSHGEGQTRYQVLRTGINGRLDTIQAAILLAKFGYLEEELVRREEIATLYDAALLSCVKIPDRVLNSKSAWAIYSILLSDEAERKFVQDTLKAENIPSAIYYPLPLHLQPAYHSYHDGTYLSVSEEVSKRILALPIHPELSNAQVNRVIQAVLKVKK
ncbi:MULTISPECIES: DegT/DnrJ/EryC1/StrS aminotransferase family protein [unclassified Commensalibacter]|uniref:DegT/DnrJ/EryC1/StrS family aminotransferase n=1 Tax=unclassified Commensalibacter TaxID=2630218 RepID=UPI0018DDE45B|nr:MULTISPECIES: DegT/DnrJ/EryC1/StrS family aminotransferase [unclassified Commensalibacter]MBH9969444.1 DegT/DnrJ/EryC1/StrS family aminotransferase [Commensalibacter sp. M0265]MBH9976799.1 DegT/DnrJ/EryC1/StrS family aminotransferase [Commensalibacter sp. M0266]MBH9992264.1 DegT/DnrJ/EryC1/StrS family aminotransferase [Commensalibacter sp. M0270]MBI0045975.1 DegT/DnrJ/EryC1/StrS family aminotransferase [Commensalibacter sp. M0267]MBI0055644.1 DegT/DnrJ/EryC1/StrS family aminotransferase [Co